MRDVDGPGIGRPNPDPDERHRYAARLMLVDGESLWVTTHCVDRFWERAASSETTFRAARARLLILAREYGHRVQRPTWIDDEIKGEDGWLALSEDVVLLIYAGVARTCLTRGTLPASERRCRRAERRRRRAERRRRAARPSDPDQ
jgi:hypothetical protein